MEFQGLNLGWLHGRQVPYTLHYFSDLLFQKNMSPWYSTIFNETNQRHHTIASKTLSLSPTNESWKEEIASPTMAKIVLEGS